MKDYRKYYPWIPIIGIPLVLFSRFTTLKEEPLSNAKVFWITAAIQGISGAIILILIMINL